MRHQNSFSASLSTSPRLRKRLCKAGGLSRCAEDPRQCLKPYGGRPSPPDSARANTRELDPASSRGISARLRLRFLGAINISGRMAHPPKSHIFSSFRVFLVSGPREPADATAWRRPPHTLRVRLFFVRSGLCFASTPRRFPWGGKVLRVLRQNLFPPIQTNRPHPAPKTPRQGFLTDQPTGAWLPRHRSASAPNSHHRVQSPTANTGIGGGTLGGRLGMPLGSPAS